MRRFWVVVSTIFLAAACTQSEEPRVPAPAASPPSPPAGETKPPAPAPAPEAKTMTFHSFSAAPLGLLEPVSLAKYQGKVLLVANTAAHCGYTPQYTPLGEVDRKFKDKGFAVLGFVSNDFGHQGGTTEEVKACSIAHRAGFDQFAESHVKKGPEQTPLFVWLTSQPGLTDDVTWNFNKWLIGKNGALLGRWSSDATPDGPEITAAIEAALASK
jgi:glutathione peroxidase